VHTLPRDTGWIEVICGPMFSGKTEELIRRLRRAQLARQRVQIFKPRLDDRYAPDQLVSHSAQTLESTVVDRVEEILAQIHPETDVVGVDEVQLLAGDVVGVCETLADAGCRVVVAGLDQDYTGAPFEPMPVLLAAAEYVTKQQAICVVCGNPAGRTQRLVAERVRVVVGATGAYEARCRACHSARPVEQLPLPGTGTGR
jgi:thymidine kinase